MANLVFTTMGLLGFDPTDDASLVSQYDASNAGTITGSSPVTAFADTQAANNLTPKATSTFISGAATQNGLNVLTYDGTTDGYLRTTTFNYGGGGNVAFHGVMQIGTVNNTSDALLSVAGATNHVNIDSQSSSVFNGRLLVDATDLATGGSQAFTGGPFSGWVNFSLILNFTAGEIYAYVGNTLRATVTGYTGALDSGGTTYFNLLASRGDGGTNPMSGAIAELCTTTDVTNRSDYYSYLQDKWNVA